MKHASYKQQLKDRRKKRVRKKVSGTGARPRLSVFRSNRHIYAQVIDDVSGRTLVAASSMEKSLETAGKKKAEQASEVGKAIAARAREAGVEAVVFDRGGNLYHGRVKALAEGAREAGLRF
jgi:large subunit ribosomal protein L18